MLPGNCYLLIALFRAFESFPADPPTDLIANCISEIGRRCQAQPLSKDGHQSDLAVTEGDNIPQTPGRTQHVLSGQMGDTTLSPISYRHLEGISTTGFPHRLLIFFPS